MYKRFLLLFPLTLLSAISLAQNLIVDGAPVLLPRLSSVERDMVSGVEGMLIFNTDVKKFQGFVGGEDIESVPPASGMEFNLSQRLHHIYPFVLRGAECNRALYGKWR